MVEGFDLNPLKGAAKFLFKKRVAMLCCHKMSGTFLPAVGH